MIEMLVRAHDPLSSVMAAEASLQFSGTHCDRILAALADQQLTAHEIAQITGLTVVQVDRRLPELKRAGAARVVTMHGFDVIKDGYRVWEAV